MDYEHSYYLNASQKEIVGKPIFLGCDSVYNLPILTNELSIVSTHKTITFKSIQSKQCLVLLHWYLHDMPYCETKVHN